MKTLPPEALATRPALAFNEHAQHPANGPNIGYPPLRYSTALHEAVIAGIKKGNRPVIAAAAAGLPSQSFYEWMKRGKEGDPHLWQFAEDVEQALAHAETSAIAVIASQDGSFAQDSDNAKWWLERSRSDGYSKEASTKVNGMLEEFFKRIEAALPPEIFQLVIAAASGQQLPEGALATRAQLSAPTVDDQEETDQ